MKALLQKVNLFLWERLEIVKNCMEKLKSMRQALQDRDSNQFAELWPMASEFWPKLEANTLIEEEQVFIAKATGWCGCQKRPYTPISVKQSVMGTILRKWQGNLASIVQLVTYKWNDMT